MPWLSRLTHNWTLKLAALGLAVLLWAVTKAEALTRKVIDDVPVEVRVDDPNWVVARGPTPDTVSVGFIGPAGELLQLSLASPRIVVPIEMVEDTLVVRTLSVDHLRLNGDLGRTQVESFRPAEVRIAFERITSRILPVAVRIVGPPAEGFQIADTLRIDPPGGVRVSGPRSRVARLDSIRTRPIDLSRLTQTTELRVELDASGLPEGILLSPTAVRVLVPIAPVPPAPPPPPEALGQPLPADTAAGDTARVQEPRP